MTSGKQIKYPVPPSHPAKPDDRKRAGLKGMAMIDEDDGWMTMIFLPF
jgi:hypothetical protein